jgi:hypothetical protein
MSWVKLCISTPRSLRPALTGPTGDVLTAALGADSGNSRRGGHAVTSVFLGALIGKESLASRRETAEVNPDFGSLVPQTANTAPWLPDVTIAV